MNTKSECSSFGFSVRRGFPILRRQVIKIFIFFFLKIFWNFIPVIIATNLKTLLTFKKSGLKFWGLRFLGVVKFGLLKIADGEFVVLLRKIFSGIECTHHQICELCNRFWDRKCELFEVTGCSIKLKVTEEGNHCQKIRKPGVAINRPKKMQNIVYFGTGKLRHPVNRQREP